MKKIIGLFALTSAALLGSPLSFAGNCPGAVTFTLGGGPYYFASKRELKNTGLPNVMLAYNFNDRWAIEGTAGRINTNQKSTDIGVQGSLFTIDGLYRFWRCNLWEPYVEAGVGVLTLSPNGMSSNSQAGANVGLGTQFFIDNAIAFRAEARDLYTFSGGKNDGLLNFGVSFLF